MDVRILAQVQSNIRADSTLSQPEKEHELQFFEKNPVSRIVVSEDPRLVKVQQMFEPVENDYWQFRWYQRIAWICLGTIAVTFVIVGLSVAFSFRSNSAQYYALRLGWPVLRTSAAILVVGLSILALALSYWVTAIFFNLYVVKLLLLAAILAATAVYTLLKAVFTKPNEKLAISGEAITETDAPVLWQRVRDMAAQMKTAPPDRIVVGIDPSFFVTEHPVTLAGQVQTGRTLYLSLPILKILSVEEADTILGHELAHFNGSDTLWSRKVSPLISKFHIYMGLLSNGLGLIVAHFMHFFWKLYSLSINKLSRAREFRADRLGAEAVSKEATKRALVKITSYCEYRAKTEQGILRKERVDEDLNLPLQLERGYPAFLSSFTQDAKAVNERVPHPFDSHPTLSNRISHLGFAPQEALRDATIQQPISDSWYAEIATAPAIEEKLWLERQGALKTYHKQALIWTLDPKDEEQKALVLEAFPHMEFRDKKGNLATIDYDRIAVASWEGPIFFRNIQKAIVESAWPVKRLTLKYSKVHGGKPVSIKFAPANFKNERGDLMGAFAHYFHRHKTAEAASQQAAPENAA